MYTTRHLTRFCVGIASLICSAPPRPDLILFLRRAFLISRLFYCHFVLPRLLLPCFLLVKPRKGEDGRPRMSDQQGRRPLFSLLPWPVAPTRRPSRSPFAPRGGELLEWVSSGRRVADQGTANDASLATPPPRPPPSRPQSDFPHLAILDVDERVYLEANRAC